MEYACGRMPECVMPVRVQVLPPVSVRAAVDAPPIGDRSTVTAVTVPLTATAVHLSTAAGVPSGRMEAGLNAQAETAGAPAVIFSVAFIVAVKLPESVAVTASEFDIVAVVFAAVTPVSCQVFPAPCVRAAVAKPPMAVRLTVTDERLGFMSEAVQAVQVRVVAAVASEWMED